MPTAASFEEFDYVLKSERSLPPEKQTVFRLKPLNFREKSECERVDVKIDSAAFRHVVFDRMGLARKQLTFGLVNWKNFNDKDGNPIAFQRMEEGGRFALPDNMLNLIGPWAIELANAIDQASEVSEESAKNC